MLIELMGAGEVAITAHGGGFLTGKYARLDLPLKMAREPGIPTYGAFVPSGMIWASCSPNARIGCSLQTA
jgi:hypothetical protein